MPGWIHEWRMTRGGKGGEGGSELNRSRRSWSRPAGTRVISILSAFAILSAFSAPLNAQTDLARRIDARLNRVPFNRQLWGLALMDESGRSVYGQNDTRMFVPASNTKLVVAAVASALLPP